VGQKKEGESSARLVPMTMGAVMDSGPLDSHISGTLGPWQGFLWEP
jgi:hypothetical protein